MLNVLQTAERHTQTDARQNVILKLNYEDLRSGKLKTVLI